MVIMILGSKSTGFVSLFCSNFCYNSDLTGDGLGCLTLYDIEPMFTPVRRACVACFLRPVSAVCLYSKTVLQQATEVCISITVYGHHDSGLQINGFCFLILLQFLLQLWFDRWWFGLFDSIWHRAHGYAGKTGMCSLFLATRLSSLFIL